MEAKFKGVKRQVGESKGKAMYIGGASIVESKAPGVTLPCEKLLNQPEKLAELSGPVKKYHISELQKE